MMKEHYLDLRLQEFLDSITNKRNIIKIQGTKGIVEGTLPELKSYFSLSSAETQKKILPKLAKFKEFAIDYEFSDIEILNYLEHITSGFDRMKTKLVLLTVKAYYEYNFKERIIPESIKVFKEKDWEIPIFKIPKIDQFKAVDIPDYDKMLNITHLFEINTIKRVINLLEEKLGEFTKTVNSNEFPEIFTEGGYQIFIQLNEQYKIDDKALKAKYSYLYHFLQYEGKLACNHTEYIDFLKKEGYVDSISKIQPTNTKYEERIQPYLKRILTQKR